jgi:hypothetical protein
MTPPAADTSTPVSLGRKARAHEWLSFDDPDEVRTWVFDVTFLLSRWTCIFGQGCQGVLTGPSPELVQGCCSYGAHATDEADEARVEEYARRLTADQWQYRKQRGTTTWHTGADGDRLTKQVNGACIFLNRPGFARGPGCALHVGALDAGERPLDWKPNVCWQLPLRREDETLSDGRVISTVRQWDRVHWGEGGDEFAWWCTEADEAFTGVTRVYESLRDELVELTSPIAYGMVAAWCEERIGGIGPLPHPAVKRAKVKRKK